MKTSIIRTICIAFLFFTKCVIADYPYFLKEEEGSCLGLQYLFKNALILFSYTEAPYGHPSVEKYLKNAGLNVISYNMTVQAQEPLTRDYLDKNQISQIWLFSSCNAGYISEETVELLYQFSRRGGSLTIAADNHPCINDCIAIANKFRISFASSQTGTVGLLKKSDGTLGEHCITRNIDELEGGVTPSNIVYPLNDKRYTLVGKKGPDNLFVIFNDGISRVFIDSAWTRYNIVNDIPDPKTQMFINNIINYLECQCN
jgi:hypothetical protein